MVSAKHANTWGERITTEAILLLVFTAAQAAVFWPGYYDIADSTPHAIFSLAVYCCLRLAFWVLTSTWQFADNRGWSGMY